MNCINCGKPHSGHFTMLLGVFELCRQCETTGTQNENMLKQGIVVESVDQKTGQMVKQTFCS